MKYRKGYKYQLVKDEIFHTRIRSPLKIETEFITLWPGGKMEVRSGYAWDGPSGPTWDTDNSMTPSLYHDAAYQLMRSGQLATQWRPFVDEEFGYMLEQRGMTWLRRKLWVREVKKFAAGAASPENKKEVFEVP